MVLGKIMNLAVFCPIYQAIFPLEISILPETFKIQVAFSNTAIISHRGYSCPLILIDQR